MHKYIVLLLMTCLVASSLLVILPASLAQTKPTKPTLTIQQETEGIYLKIKNQPFTPYTNSNGYEINLYYQYRFKSIHASADTPSNWQTSQIELVQSNSEHIMIPLSGWDMWNNTDFQVRLLIGTFTVRTPAFGYSDPAFEGVTSDWSSTQTLKIYWPNSSSTSTPPRSNNPNPSSPNQHDDDNLGLFGLASWAGVAVVVLLSVVVILLAIIAVSCVVRQTHEKLTDVCAAFNYSRCSLNKSAIYCNVVCSFS
ncbi:MAG: hypothetical protein FWD52_01700 [Candidatus Bathyarchaeota archaeon]|nr:hypothetical protein [Candidatus Termiticorpusculum sp.]